MSWYRVGIGTSSPSVPLDILTNLSSDTTSSPDTVLTLATKYASTGTNGAAGAGPRLEFKIPDDETNPITGVAIAGIKEAADDSDASAGMAFYISQNDTTLDEAVRIDHDGNIGIGTQAPAKRLHIRDDTQTNQSIRFGNETAAPYGEINYNSSGSEHLYIDSHGTTSGYGFTKLRNGPDLHESITINSDGYVTISRDASEYGTADDKLVRNSELFLESLLEKEKLSLQTSELSNEGVKPWDGKRLKIKLLKNYGC